MIEELKFELEYAIAQLEKAADWAPARITTDLIKMQCEEARRLLKKVDAQVAEQETKALMDRLKNPKL